MGGSVRVTEGGWASDMGMSSWAGASGMRSVQDPGRSRSRIQRRKPRPRKDNGLPRVADFSRKAQIFIPTSGRKKPLTPED